MKDLSKSLMARYRKEVIVWSLVWAIVIAVVMFIGLSVFPNNFLGNTLQLVRYERLMKELVSLQQEEEALKMEVPEKKDSYDDLRKLISEIELKVLEMENEKAALEEKITQQGPDYLALQEEYKRYYTGVRDEVWKRMEGKALHNIKLKDGTRVEDVTIRDMAEEGIRVKKEFSYRTLNTEDLSEDTKKRYLLGVSDLELYMQERGELQFSMD